MNDWKTTVPGLIAAICIGIMPVVPHSWLVPVTIINAASLATLGFFAKQTEKK